MDNILEIEALIVNDHSSVETITEQISVNLNEPNKEFLCKLITVLGIDNTLKLYEETRLVEQRGGLYCKDGSRRKKPGGVFFYLIYHNFSTDNGDIKKIFSDEAHKSNKNKKYETKERRRKHNAELKKKLIEGGLLVASQDKLVQRN